MTNHADHGHPKTAAARRACRAGIKPSIRLDRVELTGPDSDGLYSVHPYFAGVDRPDGIGYGLSNIRTAQRLVKALESGQLFTDLVAKIDVNGKTYASYTMKVRARTASADLKRLGF